MASSPTPSEDNRTNERQDTMSKALDRIMTNTEQSYDDFVGSFTYLKRDDILPQNKHPHRTDLLGKKGTAAASKENITESTVSTGDRDRTLQSNCSIQDHQSHEDLETEELQDGVVSSRLSQSKMIRTGAAVKVDNFVDDEDAELFTDGYMASFSTGSDQSQSRASQSTNQPRDRTANELTDMCSGLSLDENSTDKLLLNFLADLQNEANERIPTGKPVQRDSSLDIQEFLDKKQELEEVTFSDDDGDAASNLVDNSEQGSVKVVVKPEELVDIENSKKSKTIHIIEDDEIPTDSEGVRIVNEPKKDTVDGSEEEPKDILFPGEVETTDDQPGTRHQSLLDFKATYREPSISCDEGSNQVECSDSVEPFCLDADFDYDNVVLTPKFSQADIQKMQTLISQP